MNEDEWDAMHARAFGDALATLKRTHEAMRRADTDRAFWDIINGGSSPA